MNPSIHFDGQLWRCSLRCADYGLPSGYEIRSDKAKPGQSRTKNAMIIFDPTDWKPLEIYKMKERDDLPRASSGSVGYEDIRLFRTDKGWLQGIAAALHLLRTDRREQLAEQVLLSFDEEYNIAEALPIRGDWSKPHRAEKNWAPFDNCVEPRFLYAIEAGKLFDDRGELSGSAAQVRLSTRSRRSFEPNERAIRRARERAVEIERERVREERRRERSQENRKRSLSLTVAQAANYEGLRGGTQLVCVDDDSWLGIGHAMQFVDGLKVYWHVWYLADSYGKMKAASPPMKLAPNNGIEFAAGLAIDGDRVVVSFGVDDMESKIGETKLSAVRGMLRSIDH